MLKEIQIKELEINPFTAIGNEWMLITAGDKEKYNTMTASWGSLGVLWNKNVSTVVIRPQRYTFEFTEEKEYYSLSFFDSDHKKALAYCGSHSGRDVNKAQETGLTSVFDQAAPYFAEASLVIICRKIHKQRIDPKGFLDSTIEGHYPEKDYHESYVGEVVKILKKEK